MCGHDEYWNGKELIKERRKTTNPIETDLRTADMLISEAHDMIIRFVERLAKLDPDKPEAVLLANSLDNFRRRDEPTS